MRGRSRFASAAFALAALAVTRSHALAVDLRGLDAPPEPAVTNDQIAPYLESGTASLSGRVIAKLPGMSSLYFRNTTVRLWPAIPYTNWLIDDGIREDSGAFRSGAGDHAPSLFFSAVRSTTTDAQGNFRFENLPALPFVVFVYASETASRYGTAYRTAPYTSYEMRDGNSMPVTLYRDEPYTYRYTCRSAGWLFGGAVANAASDTSVPLTTMYSKNDGC